MLMLHLMVDAGHGINTSGKRVPDGSMREFEFNRVVALKIESKMRYFEGVKTYRLYDEGGRDVSLDDRTDRANGLKAQIGEGTFACVSVHANGFDAREKNDEQGFNAVQGIETFSYNGHSPNGDALAGCIQKHMIANCKRPNRGHKKANFHMVREPIMASALVECGFMTNREEAELLKSEAYRETCATAIADALIEHYELKRKKTVAPKPTLKQDKLPAKSNHTFRLAKVLDTADVELAQELKKQGFYVIDVPK
jgi:N-acetylmuramoyl-L-alanine amidase